MAAYYNENDPKAAAWLRELIKAGAIAPGVVDDRSILDVKPGELTGFTQCHFFAGIGGWSAGLRLAGWPDDRPVWTGSCPCQPFSVSNSRRNPAGGFADERHLWPAFFALIGEQSPPVVFGEQVASPDGLKWLDLVQADLEGAGYACGAADLCAAGVGAPHIRQRLYWVAIAGSERLERQRLHLRARQSRDAESQAGRRGEGLGDLGSAGSGRHAGALLGAQEGPQGSVRGESDISVAAGGNVAYPHHEGPQRRFISGYRTDQRAPRAAGLDSHWADVDWVRCNDPRGAVWRPIEPGTQPVADGLPARVGRLRGYGNAIVPQVAATFVRALL